MVWLAAALLTAAEAHASDLRTLVWDTGKSLTADNIDLTRREGWILVAPDTPAGSAFQGDAVIENDRLQVLCGTRCGPPLVYSKAGVGQGPRRMSLLPLNGKREPCATITAIKIVEHSGDEAVLELSSRSEGGESARTSIALGTGHRFVEVRPVQNAAAVRACAASQFAVMPDFFGDDVVFDARRSVGDQLYVPAENILLNFTGNGDTILMTVWPLGNQEVQALLAGDKAGRRFEVMEFSFDNKSLYFAVLDNPQIWHSVALDDAFCADKDVPTGWQKPFEARWRGDFRLSGRTDS